MKSKLIIIICLVGLTLPVATWAQDSLPYSPSINSEATRPTYTQQEEVQYKSPGGAFAMSFLSTALPLTTGLIIGNNIQGATAPAVGLVGLGLLVGPSIGHFYAGETGHGLLTSGLRTAMAIAAVGILFNDSSDCYGKSCPPNSNNSSSREAWFLALSTATVGLAIYDLIDAPFAAKRANKRHREKWISITPTILKGEMSANNYGVAAVGQF